MLLTTTEEADSSNRSSQQNNARTTRQEPISRLLAGISLSQSLYQHHWSRKRWTLGVAATWSQKTCDSFWDFRTKYCDPKIRVARWKAEKTRDAIPHFNVRNVCRFVSLYFPIQHFVHVFHVLDEVLSPAETLPTSHRATDHQIIMRFEQNCSNLTDFSHFPRHSVTMQRSTVVLVQNTPLKGPAASNRL